MTKPGDLPTTKKTMRELAKEFPNKTYGELEKYRDADRQEEAIGIGHNRPPEGTLKKACTLGEMKKDREFEKEIDYHRYWKDMFEKEHKLRQEAEGELSIMKGIETNRVKEVQARCNQLQDELDRVKKEKNDLFIRISELIKANEKEVKNLKWIKDQDYVFLVDENKRLHEEIKKLKNGAKVDRARKAGL